MGTGFQFETDGGGNGRDMGSVRIVQQLKVNPVRGNDGMENILDGAVVRTRKENTLG